jgi:membrane protein implicated in regulation of membrane protease activity
MKLGSGLYFKNILTPFIIALFLGLAATNSAGLLLNQGGLSLPVQLITTLVPLFFWLIAISLSHPWTAKTKPRMRATIHSMIATLIILIWLTFISVMFILSTGSASGGVPIASIVMAALLELLLLLTIIVASFLNAWLSSKGIPSAEEEGELDDIKEDLDEALIVKKKTANSKTAPKANPKSKTSSKPDVRKVAPKTPTPSKPASKKAASETVSKKK